MSIATAAFCASVGEQIAIIAAEEISIHFQRDVTDLGVFEKSPGEVVCKVDLAMQERLVEMLDRALPGALVVSEELPDPRSALIAAHRKGLYWVVDPLDGTANFLAGKTDFGVMVALCEGDEPLAAWLHAPRDGRSAYGARGPANGFWHASVPLCPGGSCVQKPDGLSGVLAAGDFPREYRARVMRQAESFSAVRGTASCTIDYLDLLWGRVDFLLYRRTLPWDHAAGSLLTTISGGRTTGFWARKFSTVEWDAGLLAARDGINYAELEILLPNSLEFGILDGS